MAKRKAAKPKPRTWKPKPKDLVLPIPGPAKPLRVDFPAFPRALTKNDPCGQTGMTLRDYFAGQALIGFCVHQGWIGYQDSPEHRTHLLSNYTRDAYAMADAMLEARKQ